MMKKRLIKSLAGVSALMVILAISLLPWNPNEPPGAITRIKSSEVRKWGKITNDKYFSAYSRRFEKRDNFMEIIHENHSHDAFEFYYNIFDKKKSRPARVMLISLDTVGAKHLGLYGYKKFNTSPGLEKIVENDENAYFFTRAFGQSWWTLPAHATMLTGLHPAGHNLTIGGGNVSALNKDLLLLSQALQKRDIYTYHCISTRGWATSTAITGA